MLKKENLRKNFLRVKQIADQNLGRSEKSEVLSEDLQSVEKRVELVKTVLQTTAKKIGTGLQSSGSDFEKRLKKLPETALAHSMIENANLLGSDTLLGSMLQLCGECQSNLATSSLQYEIDTENQVLGPLSEIQEVDIPAIAKAKKQLTKLTLDMDSAKSRYNQAVRQTQVHGTNIASAAAKADQVKEEYEDASNRMHQARDTFSTEMFNFISKEPEHSQKLLALLELQLKYHKHSMAVIEKVLPKMKDALDCNPHKPAFGVQLEEHLRVTGRDIALVIEACVLTLLEGGMEEEGLFRIAGMASRVKKLKTAFDAGIIDMEEFMIDIHTVAGALKQYLRELPEPLLTYQLYQEFLSAAQLPMDERLQALWTSIHSLPPPNYNNFRYLVKFLSKLAEKSDINKMTPSNIAIVIGPNLLWSEGDDGPNMVTSGTISNLFESIIIHADWFFPEDVEFGSLASISSQDSSSPGLSEYAGSEHQLDDPDGSFSTPPPNVTTITTTSPQLTVGKPLSPSMSGGNGNAQTNNSLAAPLAECEQMSPKTSKRVPKKPAPPPPPERPYSVAVTATMGGKFDSSVQCMTWPRQAGNTSPMETPQEKTEKSKSPPERPVTGPEKSINPHRAHTIHYSHTDRPSVPPPERPKIPPPVVPNHQRSASTGSPANIDAPPPTFETMPQNGQGRLSASQESFDNIQGMGPLNKNPLTNSSNQLIIQTEKPPANQGLNHQGSTKPPRPSVTPKPSKITEQTHL